jgi:ABC-type polysaccharide/polyol phosphate transport system ATPase subunit
MNSTENSDSLLTVSNLKVYFQLDHYLNQSLREVFVTAINKPIDYFFKPKELFYVLNGVNFEVKKGMRIGILGVNGSGKTTLCRCISGMMKPQEGMIKTKAEVRAIFDTGTGIMPDLTGRENAMLLARLFYPFEKNLTSLVDEVIEFSELGHFADTPLKAYSKGMQSRLLLSLISSRPSEVLILDEVFDGADIFFQQKLSERMKNFINNAQATLFVSHSPDQIKQLCNKVLVLNEGKVQFFGEVEEGIEHYLNIKK